MECPNFKSADRIFELASISMPRIFVIPTNEFFIFLFLKQNFEKKLQPDVACKIWNQTAGPHLMTLELQHQLQVLNLIDGQFHSKTRWNGIGIDGNLPND